MFKKLNFFFLIFIFSLNSFGQYVVTGKILDQNTLLPISDVNIKVIGQSVGSISLTDGTFTLNVTSTQVNIEFTAIGYSSYKTFIRDVKHNVNTGTIYLQPAPYDLGEISISAGLSTSENIPVSISTVSAREIQTKLGNRPLPLIMQTIPGIVSVRNGGGSGDSKLSIRGFKQEDVSILLNGIPINGQENGLIYWSNWLGLSYAAADIQIQKGPGLTNASVSAIGGSVNIITRNAQNKKSGTISFQTTNYGDFSTNIAINSGKLKSGWSTSLMINYSIGDGWVDATFENSFAYFFTAQKQINSHHKITITLLGAPQEHGQQTIKLSNIEIDNYGQRHNKDWGSYNGKIKNASVNFYHKPFLSINDDYKLSKTSTISTALYFSVGYGGGRWSESFNYAPSIFSYRNYSNQIDWESIFKNNATHTNTYTLANGKTVSGYSQNVQTNFLASHIQAGIATNFKHKINSHITLYAGFNYRYFSSYVREKIYDLLGGRFFIEDYSWSVAGVSGRNQIKTVGSIIHVDNNSTINLANSYVRATYNNNRINTYISANINNNWYSRTDRFNYIENKTSKTVSKIGWDTRVGISFNVSEHSTIYSTGALISRAPYFKYVFGNFTNVVVQDLKNEMISTIELGYKLNWKYLSSKVSVYATSRKNVSTLSNEYVQLEENTQTRAMINGLIALHKGLEFEISIDVNQNTKIGGILSLGDFSWQNNITARLFNENNVAVDTVNVYAAGLNIGGTAQQQVGIFMDFAILKTYYIKAEYLFFNNVFADFDPTNRNTPNDFTQPYKFPSYGVTNVYLDFPFTVNNYNGNLQINAYNLTNEKYIVLGEDGENHDLETFRGFWSFNRNFTFSLILHF